MANFKPIAKRLLEFGRPGRMVVAHAAALPYDDRLRYLITALRHFRDMVQTGYKWIELPVDIQTFVEHPYFLNQMNEIYPAVMRDLIELNSGKYVEAVLTGGIGVAKTSIALLSICYQLYMLSRMSAPHEEFELQSSTEIVFIFQSITSKLAKGLDYMRFQNMVTNSKYFQEEFPHDRSLTSELHFPRRIIVKPLSGDPNAAIGQNIIGGVIDEINFMEIIESSTRASDGGEYDQATMMYNTIQRRRKSRFMARGRLPGLICLMSSKRYPGEFTDRKMAEARDELRRDGKTTIFVYDKKIWEVKPEGTFSGRTFKLFLGDTSRKPRVVEEDDVLTADEEPLVMEIPIEFRSDFDRDLLSAIRDIAGMATLALHPFIMDVETAVSAFGRVQSVLSQDACDFVNSTVMIYPKRFWNPKEPRFAHIDLALTGDSAGVAVGCVRRFVEIKRGEQIEMMPEINMDLLLEVRPPKNGEIEFSKIRALLYKLRESGLNLKWVSFDSFQSRDSIQILSAQGFITGTQSMDIDSKPYDVLKSALYDKRLLSPASARCQTEIVRLERDPKKGLIDHPAGGCFTAETRVALANGTLPTMRQLSKKYAPGEIFYVYSMAPHGITIAPAHSPRITKKALRIVEVTLDNFQVVRCTPEHLFMTLMGDWVQAQNLTPAIRLMPLYRSRADSGGWEDYERVWCPTKKQRLLTHQLACPFEVGVDEIVHHIDENKSNNDPRNLLNMSHGAHLVHHGNQAWALKAVKMKAGFDAHFANDDAREASRQRIKATWEAGKFGPPAAPCSLEGCESKSNARGLCDKHYQAFKRAGKLPARGSAKNHRILSVEHFNVYEDVYDITVPGTENFALASGVFVHNSKDVADALCGVVYGLTMQRQIWAHHNVPLSKAPASLTTAIEKSKNLQQQLEIARAS